jgi:hypothetical protein
MSFPSKGRSTDGKNHYDVTAAALCVRSERQKERIKIKVHALIIFMLLLLVVLRVCDISLAVKEWPAVQH